jgi:hypothetical protein
MTIVDRRGNIITANDPSATTDPGGGVAIKAPVIAAVPAATGNIVLSGLQTIDDVVLAEGDRVLVTSQTNPVENGIYNASSGVWLRSVDADSGSELVNGTLVYVIDGSLNGDKIFKLTVTSEPIVIDTDSQTWDALAYPHSGIPFTLDGNGSSITTGYKGAVEIPFDCYIIAGRLSSPIACSVEIEVWRSTYAQLPQVAAHKISATDPLVLSSAEKSQNTTLTGWSRQFTAGDWAGFNVASVTGAFLISGSLRVLRN